MKNNSFRIIAYSIIAVLLVAAIGFTLCNSSSVAPISESVVTPNGESVYAPVDVNMELVKVGNHSWYVQGKAGIATDNAGFISNAGVIVTDEGVVIFDGLGSPSLANKLVGKIKEITDKPIVKVVVSHYHADHIYGLQVFKELGAEIVAPDGVYEYIDSEGASSRLEERRFSLDPWVNDQTVVVTPDRIIDKSEDFTLGGIKFTI